MQHSHGLITRDGVTPAEFRAIANGEIAKYRSVQALPKRVRAVTKVEGKEGDRAEFEPVADDGEIYGAANVMPATGLRETLPAVEGIYNYYGRSLFNCPYCDGWEVRDKRPVIIAESERGASHLPKVIYNWSREIVVCTNGHQALSDVQKELPGKY